MEANKNLSIIVFFHNNKLSIINYYNIYFFKLEVQVCKVKKKKDVKYRDIIKCKNAVTSIFIIYTNTNK